MQVKILGRKCDVYILIACVVLGVFVGVNLLCNCPSCGVSGAEGFAGLEGADHEKNEEEEENTSDPAPATGGADAGDGTDGPVAPEKFTLEGMTVGKKGKDGVAAKCEGADCDKE